MVRKLSREDLYNRVRPYEVNSLFKYRSFSSRGLEDIFVHQQVFFASPVMFNDPFDCNPRLTIHHDEYKQKKFFLRIIKKRDPDVTKKRIKKLIKSPQAAKLRDPSHLKILFRELIGTYGVYSMSEVPDDILMWAHYSDAHAGICLEFDSRKINTLFWESFKITYQKEYPIVNAMDLGNSEEFLKALTIKADHWSYEKERRILRTREEGGPGIYKFDSRLLIGVILGVRISAENERRVMDWVEQYPTPIKISKARLNDQFYSLDIAQVR